MQSGTRRSYRGPAALGFTGLLLALVGVSAAGAAVLIVQFQGALNGDLLGTAADAVLGTNLAPGSGAADISLALLIAFVAGCMLTALGSGLLLGGAVWAVVRWEPRRRSREVKERAQPAIDAGRRGVELAKPVAGGAVRRGRRLLEARRRR